MLEKFGYRVLPAANGAEAIKIYALRQDEIAAVITDMAMPVMDGHATITALRALNPKVKVIGSSGLDMNDDLANAVHAATRRFIPKPYTLESMLNILHEVLQENPKRRERRAAPATVVWNRAKSASRPDQSRPQKSSRRLGARRRTVPCAFSAARWPPHRPPAGGSTYPASARPFPPRCA